MTNESKCKLLNSQSDTQDQTNYRKVVDFNALAMVWGEMSINEVSL